MSIFWPFLKLYFFFSLTIILFFPQYQKRRFLIEFLWKTPIRQTSIFAHNPWTNPFKKCPFFNSCENLNFFGLKMIVCYLKYPKTIFSHIISVKNSDKRRFNFWTKSMDLPLWKMSTFCPFFKTSIVFYLKSFFSFYNIKNHLFWYDFCEIRR